MNGVTLGYFSKLSVDFICSSLLTWLGFGQYGISPDRWAAMWEESGFWPWLFNSKSNSKKSIYISYFTSSTFVFYDT